MTGDETGEASDTWRPRASGPGTRAFSAWALPPRDRLPWAAVAAILVGPLAVAALLIFGDLPWRALVAVSDATVSALYGVSEKVRLRPGEATEVVRALLAATLLAIPPAIGIGLFEPRWITRCVAAMTFYPAWLVVTLAPAGVVRQFAYRFETSLLDGHLATNFIVLFSSAAMSIAMLYSLWGARREARRLRFVAVEAV